MQQFRLARHMFKEEEKGNTRVNFERTDEAISTGANIIASACPFCNTMLTDGVKHAEKEESVIVMDIAELIASNIENWKSNNMKTLISWQSLRQFAIIYLAVTGINVLLTLIDGGFDIMSQLSLKSLLFNTIASGLITLLFLTHQKKAVGTNA